MLLFQILAFIIHGKVDHTKIINLIINYLMDHILYHIFKTNLSIASKSIKQLLKILQ